MTEVLWILVGSAVMIAAVVTALVARGRAPFGAVVAAVVALIVAAGIFG